jgi:hypothetical protein
VVVLKATHLWQRPDFGPWQGQPGGSVRHAAHHGFIRSAALEARQRIAIRKGVAGSIDQ